MKKIKISLEYGAFPIWFYDESGNLIDNVSPEELRNNKQIDDRLLELQKEYEALFINNKVEFTYKDFQDEEAKYEFQQKVDSIISEITNFVNNNYQIENAIDITTL